MKSVKIVICDCYECQYSYQDEKKWFCSKTNLEILNYDEVAEFCPLENND